MKQAKRQKGNDSTEMRNLICDYSIKRGLHDRTRCCCVKLGTRQRKEKQQFEPSLPAAGTGVMVDGAGSYKAVLPMRRARCENRQLASQKNAIS